MAYVLFWNIFFIKINPYKFESNYLYFQGENVWRGNTTYAASLEAAVVALKDAFIIAFNSTWGK